jgi:hypothetical protein
MTLILRTLASALLLILLVTIIPGGQAEAQAPLPGFTIRKGLPDADVTVKQVTYGNGIYLACLIYPVRLYSSHDGIDWSEITGPPLGPDYSLDDYRQQASVAFGAGRFVLTSDSGRIFSTTDLSTWTQSASGTTNNIATVRYLNGNFYAVGDAGTFLSSPDGVTWTTRTTGVPNPGYNYQEVLYGNGHLVITAVTPHVVYDSSSAGWTADSSRSFDEHGFARGRFYEFGSNMVSTDMHTWSPLSVASDAGGGFSVFEDSTQVYLLSGDYDEINYSQVWEGRISTSTDGINFGPINSVRVAGQGDGDYFNHRYFIYPGDAHAALTGSADGAHFYMQGSTDALLATNGQIYVKLTLTGDAAYIYTSQDLTNWISRDTIPLSGVGNLIYDGNQFLAVGAETFTSPDGITWTDKGASPHGFYGIAYGSGLYIAWGPGDGNGNDSLWYSSDGASWALSATPQGSGVPYEPPSTVPYGSVLRVRILNGNIFIFATARGFYGTDPSNYNFTTTGQQGGDVAYDADSGRYYFIGLGTDSVGAPVILTASMTDPATFAGVRTTVGTLTGPAASFGLGGVSSFDGFAYNHGHFVTTFDNYNFNPYPYTYLLSTSDQVHWESQLLDREMQINSWIGKNDTIAIEGTHAYEILEAFSNPSPLPVTLLNFQAVAQDNTRALLTWQTASEQNSRFFVVQRNAGVNTYSWDSIGAVPAAGNSSSLLSYNFTDEHPLTGSNYYRLALVNADNSRQYSEVREVSIGEDAAITVYPNPARAQLIIQRTIDNGDGSVMLYDGDGRVVWQGVLTGTSLTLSMDHLAAGVYQLMIRQANGGVYRKEILHY